MTDPSVTERPTFGATANELRRLADLFDSVADVEIKSTPWVKLDIQVGGTDAEIIENTDMVGLAVFGKPGAARLMSNNEWFYELRGHVGIVELHLYDSVAESTVRERELKGLLAAKEAELARLSAEVEKLRGNDLADPSGLLHSRADDGDDPTPIGERQPPHTGAMTDEGLVDETPSAE